MSVEVKGLRVLGIAAAAVCVLAAGFARPANAAVNLLLAPGFEAGQNNAPNASNGDIATAGTTPWSSWNNWAAPTYTGFYTTAATHSGSQAIKTYSGPNCGVFQTVGITAGNTYTASAFFLNASFDPLTAGAAQTIDVRLTFQDAAGNAIGDAVVSPSISGASPQDVWTQLSVSAVAPAGASQVQFLGFMNNPNNGGGSLFMDDASLVNSSAVPEPASLSVIGAGVTLLLGRRRRGV